MIRQFELELAGSYPDIRSGDLLDTMSAKGWVQSPETARQQIAALALEEGWRVISSQIGYHASMEKNGSFIIFSSPVGDIRFYSRTKLTEMVGEPWARAMNVAGWASLAEGKRRQIEHVVITWERKTRPDQSYYLVASAVEQLDGRLDEILFGEGTP